MSAQPPAARAAAPWLAPLLRPRPLGAALLLGLLGLQVFADVPVQALLRNAWLDAYQKLMPRQRASAPAVIIAVDEKSLARLGQWPWPRTLVARLLDAVAARRPLAVGVDVIFAEPDRLSPGAIAEHNPEIGRALASQLKRLASNDEVLAAAIRRAPVVLGVAGLDQPGEGDPPRSSAIFRMQGDPLPHLWRFPAALKSLALIDSAAASRALLSADVLQGIVRRVPLIVAIGDAPFPSLSLETLRVGIGADAFTVRTGRYGVESIAVGDVVVPTDPDGNLWVRFGRHDPARFVSAADVLAGTVDPEEIAGKLALLGVTGIGLLDQQATPLGERMPGIEIHAQVLENIFERNLLRRPHWVRWTETALLALLGAAFVLAVPGLSPLRSSLLALSATGGLLLLGIALFRYGGLLFDAASPAVALNVLFGGLLRATLGESARQQERLKRELAVQREAAARMAGELEAARRVQLGMLPVPALSFRGERRFELNARMEPAKEVGGDLYDFFMLDGSRLFMMVGDVSGKGLPASIFMALSKALYKSAALRRLPDLSQTMAEANIEISRENPEMLFVTVLACVLDVDSGELAYCSAGHEPPHLIGSGGRVVTLTEGGGPPLCTVQDYSYRMGRRRLVPGDTLVMVSDGVPEAMDRAGALFGRARVGEVLAAMPVTSSAEERVAALREAVRRHSDGAEMADDVTILAVRWRGPAAAHA